MNIKGKDLLGKKIIAIATGTEIGNVEDIIYDPLKNQIRGILVDKGGWFSEAQIILMTEVKSIGPDALMVENETAIKKASDIQGRVSNIAEEGHYLTKTRIITEEGKELGTVSDLIFDSETGDVAEFEISEGVLKNMQSGKKYVQIHDIVTIGEEATIVRNYTEHKLEDQAQTSGVQGLVNKGQEKSGQVWEELKQETKQTVEKVQDKASDVKSQAQDMKNESNVQEKASSTFNEIKHEVKQAFNTIKEKTNETKEVEVNTPTNTQPSSGQPIQ
jgi:uncharacterized protein YrrD